MQLSQFTQLPDQDGQETTFAVVAFACRVQVSLDLPGNFYLWNNDSYGKAIQYLKLI